jgi:transposase
VFMELVRGSSSAGAQSWSTSTWLLTAVARSAPDSSSAVIFTRLIVIPRLDGNPENPLRISPGPTLLPPMIRPGFLDSESRLDLIDLARDGAAAHRLARRANALVLLDDGLSCEAIGKVLFLDGDTIREWHKLYLEDGIEGLATFNHEGGSCRLTAAQQEKLKTWIAETLPRTTRQVGAWIANEFCVEDQTLMHPLICI